MLPRQDILLGVRPSREDSPGCCKQELGVRTTFLDPPTTLHWNLNFAIWTLMEGSWQVLVQVSRLTDQLSPQGLALNPKVTHPATRPQSFHYCGGLILTNIMVPYSEYVAIVPASSNIPQTDGGDYLGPYTSFQCPSS